MAIARSASAGHAWNGIILWCHIYAVRCAHFPRSKPPRGFDKILECSKVPLRNISRLNNMSFLDPAGHTGSRG